MRLGGGEHRWEPACSWITGCTLWCIVVGFPSYLRGPQEESAQSSGGGGEKTQECAGGRPGLK